ncbi:hypothetical protein [Burkholderia savannae]|uniref:hypothetical protein n=1 Tax=Burkholderia savannae TaxID=1637837 RepID=UPI000B0B32CD|nr:hypothetical protein [Burkholderia savannae]
MKPDLDIKFDRDLRIVGLARLNDRVDRQLGRFTAVVTWEDGFALLVGDLFLSVPHETHGDELWCFAVNVGAGPDGWHEVRKFASVDEAVGYLEDKSVLDR